MIAEGELPLNRHVTPEMEQSTMEGAVFVITRPGGNDTALIAGIPSLPTERKKMNDAIMGIYPNVEQVGFIHLDPNSPELQMAGGEFCGNATRATAWQVLQGKPGNIEMTVSGVRRKLKAGVSEAGEAYAEMPIYSDPSKIVRDDKNPDNFTVEMEGITHYIDFDTEQIEGLTPDQIKEKAGETIKERGLDKYAAAGVMYTKRTSEGLKLTPVVFVRDIHTLFYETACGSGTAALGLATAVQEDRSIDQLPVIQPSGYAIKVSVAYEQGEIGYTQIQGPVNDLAIGTLETGKQVAYAIEQVSDSEQLQIALRERGLRETYRDAFGREPYFETFTDGEIDEMFADYVQDGNLLVAVDKGEIIAFGATQPLQSVPDIGDILAGQAGIDPTSWYIPDLGIRKEYEGKGIAKKLMQKSMDAIPDRTITLRTTVLNKRSQGLYHSLGFDIVPDLYQQITRERTDGDSHIDQRLFMVYTGSAFQQENEPLQIH